jgi:hypothetical protein
VVHEVNRSRGRRSTLGNAVVVFGAALFVTSCFLPYAGFGVVGLRTTSLYELQTVPGGGASDLSALLYLFGGVVTVAAVAIIALMRGGRGPVLTSLLVGAVIVWSLTSTGVLLRYATFGDISLEFGFWLQAVSICVVVIGTILVGFGMWSDVKDSRDRYANEERTNTDA